MKINSQQLRAAMVCQGNRDVRYYLNGVHIKGNKIEATNGHVAVVMTMKNKVRGEWIVKVKGKIPKTAKLSKFEFSKTESIVKHYDQFKSLICVHLVDVIDGPYPDLSKVGGEANKEAKHMMFNAAYVTHMVTMFGNKDGCGVVLYTNTEQNAIRIKPISSHIKQEYGDPLYFVMPMRCSPEDIDDIS